MAAAPYVVSVVFVVGNSILIIIVIMMLGLLFPVWIQFNFDPLPPDERLRNERKWL